MTVPTERFEFASDNTAAICPAAWTGLATANIDAEVSYGVDKYTTRLVARVREIFETDCEVFLTFNGTAANALALAQLCRPYHCVICHESAHIHTDECGAPEFFSGGAKLIPVRGPNGKLTVENVQPVMLRYADVHSSKPRVLSITQATELGTLYQIAEIETLSRFAREHSLLLHMDGARFANAVAALGCAPRKVTWEAGVDVLCFGGTKNGTAAGELVIFFRKELAAEFDYRAKQAGQLASKTRFLAAPWLGLLEGDAWIEMGRHSNRCADLLAQKLAGLLGSGPVLPREANAVFIKLPERLAGLVQQRGWRFYKFIEPDIYRLMCSWATTERQIDDFVADLGNSLAAT